MVWLFALGVVLLQAAVTAWAERRAARRHAEWTKATAALEYNVARLGRAVEKVDQDPTRRMTAEEQAAVGYARGDDADGDG